MKQQIETISADAMIQPQLINTLLQQCENGNLIWHNTLQQTIERAICRIDDTIRQKTHDIIQMDAFQTLQSRWKGIVYLLRQTDANSNIKIRCLNVDKHELQHDLTLQNRPDQSQLFKKIHDSEFNMPGGEPYALIICDTTFNHQDSDIALLKQLAKIAEKSFSPVLTSADPGLFGLSQWSQLAEPHHLANIFAASDYRQWHRFRQHDSSRFISMTLARLRIEPNCWINTSFALAERMCHAFTQYGWCTAIRGFEGGGKVTDLPLIDSQCPTEIAISDTRETELAELGFIPLCYYQNTDHAVFFGSDTLHQPAAYDNDNATRNAQIAARLPYIMATSRFAHYLKVIARDKVGAFMQRDEIEHWLNHWINQYVNGNVTSKQNLKNKYPLAAARVEVSEISNKAGCYKAVAWLKPWLQLETLSTSLRLVTEIPKSKR